MQKVFWFIGIVVWSVPILSESLHADTTYISGHITSSNWLKSNSPYIVIGDVYVDSQVTLTVDSGVEIRIDSMKSIIVYGALNAIGTENDSIIISAMDTTKRWSKILFNEASDGSLKYCRIEYAGNSAIFDSNAVSLTIEHNTITNNNSDDQGGGIKSFGPSIINGNTITSNSATFGGGIMCFGASSITNNVISNNLAWIGGGICIDGQSIISGNTITANSAECGAGIGGGGATICNNTIFGNFYGSGIGGEDFTISNNIIYDNAGGSIYLESFSVIHHNTIRDTAEFAIYINISYVDSVRIDSNNIYATGYAIYNYSDNPIDARYNYWGTVSKDTIDMKIWDFYNDPARGIVYYEPFLTDSLVFGIEEENDSRLQIADYRLEISPNPAFGKVIIKYTLSEKMNISLNFYDIAGRLVKTIYSGTQEKGYYTLNKELFDLNKGIYFIKFKGNGFEFVKKLILM